MGALFPFSVVSLILLRSRRSSWTLFLFSSLPYNIDRDEEMKANPRDEEMKVSSFRQAPSQEMPKESSNQYGQAGNSAEWRK